MSLWRKRGTSDTIAPFASHDRQNTPKLFKMTAMTDNDLSIKSQDLSIKQSKGIEMSIEAMKLALNALELAKRSYGVMLLSDPPQDAWKTRDVNRKIDNSIKVLEEALAKQEQDNAYIYASNLATAIWQKHYMKESPKFALLDTTEGVLTQIDNMTCGLVREKPAQPEQDINQPVAYINIEKRRLEWAHDYMSWDTPTVVNLPRIPLYTKPQQRTWVGLADEDDIDWEDGGNLKDLVKAIEARLKDKNL
jgi:hypothetical protein